MSEELRPDLEEQEREEILQEIDGLVASNRLPVSEEMEKLKPQKSGVGFPLIINILAVAAVLSTFYFANRMFEQKQETLSNENATYQSAEGKLLEELKKESAAKLEQKEQEIGAIQNELAELDRQSRELASSMEQQIAEREEQLRLELEQELEQERTKLLAQGKSEAAVEAELKDIEQQRLAQFENELADFKAETEKAIAEKEEELARAKQLNQELLAEVNSEKERIQTETLQRETELTAQFEAEKAALAEEAASAEAQLERLTQNQAKEALLIDQINGSYETIFDLIETQKYEPALEALDSLKKLIEDPAVATLKGVSSRSANDRAMIEILKQSIEEDAYKDDTDTKSLAAAADLLLSAQEIAARGTEAFNAGNYGEAEDYYQRSLQKIPSLNQAWKGLEQISKSNEAARLSDLLRKGAELAAAGDFNAASEQYAQAAKSAENLNPDLLGSAIDKILDASEQEVSSRVAAKDAALNELDSAKKAELDKLKKELAEAEAAAAESAEQKDAAIEALNNQLEQKTADYETKLAEADTAVSELEAEKDAEIERLTRLIGERDQQNLSLNAEKEETETELQTSMDELKTSLAETQEALASKTAELEEYKKSAEEAKGQLSSASDEQIAELTAQIEEAAAEYDELLKDYNAEKDSLSNKLRASEMTGYTNGLKQGREEAMENILYLASYLDGSAAYDPEAGEKIAELTESDPVFSQAVSKIQDIAEKSSGASALAVSREILLGTVSSASGTSIVIEPLIDAEIESGTKLIIKRTQRGRAEEYVTFGFVTSISGSSIRARTDPAGDDLAKSMDLVYITVSD